MATRESSAKQATSPRRASYAEAKETKAFSKTSEFFVWLGTVAAVLAAVLLIDGFGPDRGWTLVTALSVAYILSRGIAKSGATKPDIEGFRETP